MTPHPGHASREKEGAPRSKMGRSDRKKHALVRGYELDYLRGGKRYRAVSGYERPKEGKNGDAVELRNLKVKRKRGKRRGGKNHRATSSVHPSP